MSEVKKEELSGSGTQGSVRREGAGGVISGILAVVLALLLVAGVFAGAFYFLVHGNVYGIGEQFRPLLQNNPVLKLALPPLPVEEDPEDPANLTAEALVEKYNEYRAQVEELTASLDEAQRKLSEAAAERAGLETLKRDIEMAKSEQVDVVTELEKQTEANQTLKDELSRLIAQGDTAGFKEYFEQVDPETAERVYAQIIAAEAADAAQKQAAKPFESMDPGNAASVLEQLWISDSELTLDIFEAIRTQSGAEIMENLTPAAAAEITQGLADRRETAAIAAAAAAAATEPPASAADSTVASEESSEANGGESPTTAESTGETATTQSP